MLKFEDLSTQRRIFGKLGTYEFLYQCLPSSHPEMYFALALDETPGTIRPYCLLMTHKDPAVIKQLKKVMIKLSNHRVCFVERFKVKAT